MCTSELDVGEVHLPEIVSIYRTKLGLFRG